MPTLAELLARVSFLASMPAVVGIIVTGGILVVSREWRLNVMALAVLYFFVVLLLTRLVRLEVAAVKGLIGWMVCLVFYLTERRTSAVERAKLEAAEDSVRKRRRAELVAQSAFSLLAGVLVAVAAYIAGRRLPLPELPADLSLACYELAGLGALMVGFSDSPVRSGIGLLVFLSGFDLFYVALEPSLVVAGLLGVISFLIALVAAYLRSIEPLSEVGEGGVA